MLNRSDFMVDPALSNVSIKFSNDTFIAEKIFPNLAVAKQSGKFYTYDKSNLRVDKTVRALGAGANEVEHSATTASYVTDDHALKEFVPQEIQDQADAALDPLIDATETVTEKLMLDKELALSTLLANTANVTQNVTLSGTSQWSDYTNSDPVSDVRTARTVVHAATFKKPNTLFMGKQVFDVLCDHPQILERVKYSQLGVVTAELMARVFQVEQIIVGEAGYNSANEGQTDSLSYVWGKHAWLAFITPRAGLRQVTFGYTFTYATRVVERWNDQDRKGTYVRVGNDNYVQKIVAVGAGYLIKTAVA